MTPCRAFAFLVVAACLVAAKQVNGSPGLMHKRTDGRLPPRPGTSKPPPRRQPAVVYPNLDAAVRENVIDVDGGLVAFTSGTSTMVPLMANMWETIARLRHPFPVVAYGLDESSKAALRDVPFGRSVAEDLPEFVGTSPVNFTSGILFGSQQVRRRRGWRGLRVTTRTGALGFWARSLPASVFAPPRLMALHAVQARDAIQDDPRRRRPEAVRAAAPQRAGSGP